MLKSLRLFILGVFLFGGLSQFPLPADAATNRPPSATAQSVVTNEDQAVVITLAGTDPEGAALSYSVSATPNKGTVSCSGARCTYTPTANLTGADSFSFKVSDGTNTSAAARVSITVNAVNDAPTVSSSAFSFNEDTSLKGVLLGSDIERDALSFMVVNPPSLGSVSLSGSAFTFTPTSNLNGNDSFTFVANDGKANSSLGVISLTVKAVNDSPTTADQAISVDEDSSVDIALAANDVDGDTLTATIGRAPIYGTVSVSGKTATYTSLANFSGTDTFTYRVSDGVANSNTSTVTLTINSVNDAPVVTGTALSIQSGGTAIGTLSGTDTENSALTFSIVTPPAHGVATMTTADTFTYKSTNNYSGSDSFSFVASDGTKQSTVGTAQINVLAAGSFNPVASSALVTLNLGAASDSEKTTVNLGGGDCDRFDASPLILPGLDASGKAIEYAVGTFYNSCLNYVYENTHQFFVRTDTGEVFELSSEKNSGVEPNAFGSSTFDGTTLVTPLMSTKINSEDPDEPTGGLLIQSFNSDGSVDTFYADPYQGRAVPSVLLVDGIIPAATVNNNKPTCQLGHKISSEYCGIQGFIDAATHAIVDIAFTADNDYEASHVSSARAVVKDASGTVTYDRLVWGNGTGGNDWDALHSGVNVGGGCRINMVDKMSLWSALATKTFEDFDFFSNTLNNGVKFSDPGDIGCIDGAATTNDGDTIKSAVQGVTVGFNPTTKRPLFVAKGYQPDVFDGDQTRISIWDENLNPVCDLLVASGKNNNPFNGLGTSFAVDRLGTLYTNVDTIGENGVFHTGILAINPLDCSSQTLMDTVTARMSFSGVSLAEDAAGNTTVLASLAGALHVYNVSSGQDTVLTLGSPSDDNVSAAPVIDSAGRVIVVSNNNVMSIFKPMGLSYGRNFSPRPGVDNWSSNTKVIVLP